MKPDDSKIREYLQNSFECNVPDYWKETQIEHMNGAENMKKEKRFMKPAKWTGIAAAFAVVLFLGVWMMSPHQQGGLQYGKDTPVRVGLSQTKNSYVRDYTFAEAFEEAETVADITVVEWLGEMDEEGYGPLTYFRAHVNELYKDEKNTGAAEIVFAQAGNSKETEKGNPLYKNGDRLILCFEPIGDEFKQGRENCYGILGEGLTEAKVQENQDLLYVIPKNRGEEFISVESVAEEQAEAVIEQMLDEDEVLASEMDSADALPENVYELKEVQRVIEELK